MSWRTGLILAAAVLYVAGLVAFEVFYSTPQLMRACHVSAYIRFKYCLGMDPEHPTSGKPK